MSDHVERDLTVYDQIKQAVIEGVFAPGEKLVETGLASHYQVSRTPIREALTRLQHDGLAERRSRGYFVRERSSEEILDIYETRCVLEGMAGRVAADRRTDHDLRQLTRIARLAAEVDTDDHAAMADYNRRFHRAVWRAARHETLLDLLQRLDLHVGRYPATTLAYPGRWEESLVEHDEMVAAIQRRDAAAAEDIAYRHFLRARDIRLELAFQKPDVTGTRS